MTEPNWPSSWTRAALELCALSAVAQAGTTHGYEVARRLQNAGLGDIKGGTLYPVLSRLEEQDLTKTWWVEGAGGPGRKLIAITEKGERALADRSALWRDWSGRVDRLLGPPAAIGTPESSDTASLIR
jgi:PadR family transcriptional regulator PadR